MNYLLDTHTILWALTESRRLGPAARSLVADRKTSLVVSAASAWEIATKVRIGRLPQAEAIVAGYGRHLDRLGVGRLAITEEHALSGGSLDWDHRDPFDRILAAQAMIESLTLVTDDAAFDGLAGLRTLW